MANKKQQQDSKRQQENSVSSALKKFNWRLLGILAVACAVSGLIYFFLIELGGKYQILFKLTTAGYFILLSAAAIAYVAYNRGFAAKGVTEDMLPDTMTSDEKRSYIETSAEREKKSKWLLIAIIALALPLLADLFRLYVWDGITAFFSSMLKQ